MTQNELSAKVCEWIDSYLLANTKNPMNRFKLGFLRPLLPMQITGLCARMAGMGLGIVSPTDGNIDLPMLKECVYSGLKASSTLTVSGMTFSKEDADSLFTILESATHAVPQK